MRTLKRNMSGFYYASFAGKQEILDDNGFKTGEFDVKYTDPVFMAGNISAAKGDTDTRPFGEEIRYNKLIVMGDPQTPVNEYSILWIDRKPVLTGGITITAPDYEVAAVARSLNSVTIAIRKIDSDMPYEEIITSKYLAMNADSGYLVMNQESGKLQQLQHKAV